MSENPFGLVKTDEGDVLRGTVQPRDTLHRGDANAIETYVFVCEGDGRHLDGLPVTYFAGRWEPPVGSKVQLCGPNRYASVCGVEYIFGVDGILEVRVHLDDPDGATTPDVPGIF